MCGIAGIASTSLQIDLDCIHRMLNCLRHRGPDDEGVYMDRHISLGMRRLAVIDLPGGNQPIFNEDRSIAVVHNGEIYNYRELRSALQQKGHIFSTNSDTEVLVHAYEEYGSQMPEKISGMFAFAIYDRNKRELFLARDRLGKKPLYYYYHDKTLIFASELKSIMATGLVERDINLHAIHDYLSLQYVPAPITIFKSVCVLPPAHSLTFAADRIIMRRYWQLSYLPKLKLNENDAIEELHHRLEHATRIRLNSDVPIGLFLSGGVDSAILCCIITKFLNRKIKTYTVGFHPCKFDEREYAKQVANYLGCENQVIELPVSGEEGLDELVDACDTPLADPAALPNLLLARAAKEHITVAINGDGGDEAFAGYRRYALDQLADIYTRGPRKFTDNILSKLANIMPESTTLPIGLDPIMGLRRLLSGVDEDRRTSFMRWSSYFCESAKCTLYSEEMNRHCKQMDTRRLLKALYEQAPAESFLDSTLSVDMQSYLPGALLVKTDRTSMAAGLECRSPFLDYQLLEFAARLPTDYKMRYLKGKYLLKRAYAEHLPANIMQRTKQGFSVPVGHWFMGKLGDVYRDTVLSSRAESRGYFRKEILEQLLLDHQAQRANNGKRLWTLLVLELWHRRFVDNA